MIDLVLTYAGSALMIIGICTVVYYSSKDAISSIKNWRSTHGRV